MKKERREYLIHSFKKHSILFLGIFTIIYAMFMPDRNVWVSNYIKILLNQAYLVHDYIEIAGLSATFMNVGFHFLVAYYLMIRNELSDLKGLQVASIGIFVGHSFFGSNILNIAPIILGVVLYAKWAGHSLKRYTAVSLFATATAPIVSFIMISGGLNIVSIGIALIVGILIGFISAPLAEEFIKFHQGFTLYNFGFTTGMIAIFVSIFYGYFNISPASVYYISTYAHIYLSVYTLLIILFFLFISLTRIQSIKMHFMDLLKSSGRVPTDYIADYGLATTLFNMSINTLIFFVFILLTGCPMNGTLVGGLLSIMGFSAFGKNPKSSVSIAIGVILAGLLHGVEINESRLLLTALFCTGLSPIAGYYGVFIGILAGFVHYNLVGTIFRVHLGMTLYNNGFASGFVAAFMVPIIDTIKSNKEEFD